MVFLFAPKIIIILKLSKICTLYTTEPKMHKLFKNNCLHRRHKYYYILQNKTLTTKKKTKNAFQNVYNLKIPHFFFSSAILCLILNFFLLFFIICPGDVYCRIDMARYNCIFYCLKGF